MRALSRDITCKFLSNSELETKIIEFLKQLWALGQSFSQDSSYRILKDAESNVIGDVRHTVVKSVDYGMRCDHSCGWHRDEGCACSDAREIRKNCMYSDRTLWYRHFIRGTERVFAKVGETT
jgi:hypothetical protein